MEHRELDILYRRYREGNATADEIMILMEFLRKPEMEEAIKELLGDQIKALENRDVPHSIDISEQRVQEMLQQILTGSNQAPVIEFSRKSSLKIWRYVAAAAVILVAFVGSYLIFTNNKIQPGAIEKEVVMNDLAPGSDKAILTLADGQQIILEEADNGAIADQGNVKVFKLDGKVSYSVDGSADEVVYNTITTPRAGQYQLVLADGTKVWLDAESSFRFPNIFKGGERRVELTGQGYFEVAHNSKMPFHVEVGTMDVEVLGTHFNIKSYSDEEAVRTTLIEGSIKVTVAGKSQLIKPGQQAQVRSDNVKVVSDADTDAVMAWKNGFFSFDNADLREVMRQISRWYDVEVVYRGESKERFAGKIDRNLTLSQVLKGLADTKVNYQIEGKRLIILP